MKDPKLAGWVVRGVFGEGELGTDAGAAIFDEAELGIDGGAALFDEGELSPCGGAVILDEGELDTEGGAATVGVVETGGADVFSILAAGIGVDPASGG